MSKCIYKEIADSLNKEEVEEYYKTHLTKDVCEHFGFHRRYFYRIFDYLGIKRRTASENTKIQLKYYTAAEEHSKKLSEALIKRHQNMTAEEKEAMYVKISNTQKGREFTEEHKQHISEGNKKYYENHNVWNKGLKGAQTWVPGQRERYLKTLSENGWFNTSKPEEELYQQLCEQYGKENVKHPYSEDPRYPFACDFYIVSEDLFIELNRFWHHGPHPFDENNPEDIELLNKWKEKAKTSEQYKAAIHTWTIRDVNKIKTANKNNLNYKLIY